MPLFVYNIFVYIPLPIGPHSVYIPGIVSHISSQNRLYPGEMGLAKYLVSDPDACGTITKITACFIYIGGFVDAGSHSYSHHEMLVTSHLRTVSVKKSCSGF